MITYSLTELSDQALLRGLSSLVTQERSTTALMLAHIAEVDARKLYLPVAHSSMFDYCVGELRLSEHAAYKRINAARIARRFPEIFLAVEEGRLHLSALAMLAPYLAPHLEPNTVAKLTASDLIASELIAAASGKTRAQLQELLAARYPRPDVPEHVRALSPPHRPSAEVGNEDVAQASLNLSSTAAPSEASIADSQAPVDASKASVVNFRAEEPDNCGVQHQLAPGRVCQIIERAKVSPLSPGRYALQVTLSQETREKLRHAQELLGHELPSGAIAEVLDRALDALIERLEKRKFARTTHPRSGRSGVNGEGGSGTSVRVTSVLGPSVRGADPGRSRHVAAEVKREVWQRDQGQCTFVSADGRRCAARTRLEFDHIDEFARGGQSTIARMRLRCRAHNQYGAECTFGAGFMEQKRARARMKLPDREAHMEPKQAMAQTQARMDRDRPRRPPFDPGP